MSPSSLASGAAPQERAEDEALERLEIAAGGSRAGAESRRGSDALGRVRALSRAVLPRLRRGGRRARRDAARRAASAASTRSTERRRRRRPGRRATRRPPRERGPRVERDALTKRANRPERGGGTRRDRRLIRQRDARAADAGARGSCAVRARARRGEWRRRRVMDVVEYWKCL